MRYSILFIIVLIAMSGFIAYFGDILGWRLGKKRLSLFNLRPRYTAIVITTITGMLISALALLALLSANSDFRRVLTEWEFIRARNTHLAAANATLARTNKGLIHRGESLQQEVAAQQAEVITARKESKEAVKMREEAVGAVKRLERDIAAKTREIEARKKELAELRAGKAVVQADLDRKTAELQKVQEQLGGTQTQLVAATKNLVETGRRQADANAKLAEAQRKLAQARELVAQQEDKIKAQEETLLEQHELIVKQGLSYERLKGQFRSETFELRSGNLIFRQGDEITRGTISPNQSVFGARADLFSLLKTASDRAEELGAAAGSNGRAVNVIFRNLATREVSDDESLCVEKAAQTIASSPYDTLVQVVCAINTVAGEQLPVEMVLYRNELVYRKGDKIASGNLDGRISEGRVLLSIIDFLQTQVAQAALRNGVVPVANYDPRASLGADRQRQIEGLMTVADQVKSKNSKVSVDVYASADIYAADTLNMDNLRVSVAKLP